MRFGTNKCRPLGGPRDPRHGTPGGYSYHGCRCDVCRIAHAERQRVRSRELVASAGREEHGTSRLYHAGCRCTSCTEWGVLEGKIGGTAKKRSKTRAKAKVDLSALA